MGLVVVVTLFFVVGGWLCVCGDGEWWAVRVIRRRERGEGVT